MELAEKVLAVFKGHECKVMNLIFPANINLHRAVVRNHDVATHLCLYRHRELPNFITIKLNHTNVRFAAGFIQIISDSLER